MTITRQLCFTYELFLGLDMSRLSLGDGLPSDTGVLQLTEDGGTVVLTVGDADQEVKAKIYHYE